MAEESSFLGLYWTSLAVVGAVEMWESRSDFQGGCETRRVLHSPSFPPPFPSGPRSRDILYWKLPPPSGSSCIGKDSTRGGIRFFDMLFDWLVVGAGFTGATL